MSESKLSETVNINDLYKARSVVDNQAIFNLFLVRAVYDAFGAKGDKVISLFWTERVNYILRPKVMKIIEGNLEEIKTMFCEEMGEMPSLQLSNMEKSGITLADLHDIEDEENF